VTEVKSTISSKLGFEIRISLDFSSMAQDLTAINFAIKGGHHDSPAPIDFQDS